MPLRLSSDTPQYAMDTRRLLVTLLVIATLSAAKFGETYKGIAKDGVQSCINNSNFTRESLILRQNCREGFKCVMDNIPNYGQSILSSGSAILGFVSCSSFSVDSLAETRMKAEIGL